MVSRREVTVIVGQSPYQVKYVPKHAELTRRHFEFDTSESTEMLDQEIVLPTIKPAVEIFSESRLFSLRHQGQWSAKKAATGNERTLHS